MQTKKLKKVSPDEFDAVYAQKNLITKNSWQRLFEAPLKAMQTFNFSPAIWFVADFKKGSIVFADGQFDHLSPIPQKAWIGLSPMQMAPFFHPDDVEKMQAFVVYIAGMYGGIPTKDQAKVKASILFRMKTSTDYFHWCQMDYPGLHYVKGVPHFLLFRISDVSHLVKSGNCTLYVHDSRNKESVLFSCTESHVNLKPITEEKPLSQREKEVITLLMKGMISKEIAAALNISKNTVENHKQNIFTKTGTRNLAELIAYGHRILDDLVLE